MADERNRAPSHIRSALHVIFDFIVSRVVSTQLWVTTAGVHWALGPKREETTVLEFQE